ncbi:MAG: phage tail tape measure protein [Candidatus Peribacteraceae bacterium]|nr:phage tail tape measure protein [Candidatus Peribacteraceae bacterium]
MAANIEYPLSARFIFKGEPGTSQMNRTGRAFKNLQKNAMMARAGIQQIGSGVRQLAMAGAAVSMVMVGVIKKAAGFNKQMAVVRSVTTVSAAGFENMRREAMRLGASTSFSSKQAAEGMEHLARAGFSANMVIQAISPTLRMAEADSMSLATAAKIVAAQVKAFQLNASESQGVADALAYTSARTATDVTELGEALKYSSATASAAGQNYRDTIGALGMLANIGIRGSLAGTALKNAFLKLTRMTKASQKLFGGRKNLLNVLTDPETGKMKKLHGIIFETIRKLQGVNNEAERSAMAFKIFGLRGKAMMDALRVAKPEDLAKVFDDMGKKSAGMAMKMSKMRLDNLAGDWIIFRSAVDNAAISIGSMLEPELRKLFRGAGGIIPRIQALSKAVEDMNAGMSEIDVIKKYGKTLSGIAFGLKEAFVEVKETVVKAGGFIGKMMGRITGEGGKGVKVITKMIAKFTMFAVVLTPVIAGIGALGIVGGGALSVLIGGMKVLSALTTPWGIAMMAIVHIFAGFGKKGETTFERMARGAKNLTKAIYTITWPLRKVAQYIGSINTLLIAMAGYKITKMLITGKLMGMASKGGTMGRMMGMAGAGGMPVYITNWPMGGMGGGVPGAGGVGRGAAATTAAASSRAGFMSRWGTRLGYATGGGGMLSSMFGGKMVGGGTLATKGSSFAAAKGLATLGTAVTSLGAAAAVFLPVWGALSQVNQAYLNPHETRERLLKGHKGPKALKNFTSIDAPQSELDRKTRERTMYRAGLKKTDIISMMAIIQKARGGKGKDILEAKQMMEEFRKRREKTDGEGVKGMFSNIFGIGGEGFLKLGFTGEQTNILRELTKITMDKQLAYIEGRLKTLTIAVDGKVLGSVVSGVKGDNKGRVDAGKKPTQASTSRGK